MRRHFDPIDILVTARHLEAQGVRPTVRMVRLALGGGSPAAIGGALAAAEVTPLEVLLEQRRRNLDVELLAARRTVAELEAELARLDGVAESVAPPPGAGGARPPISPSPALSPPGAAAPRSRDPR